MFKAVIFDRDGVLVDSEGINIESTARAFRQFGYALTQEDVQSTTGRHPDDYVSEIIERNRIDLDFGKVRRVQRKEYEELWEDKNKPMPYVEQTLKELKAKEIILAIGTNAGKRRTEKFIKEHSLDGLFSIIITREDVSRRKPDPEIYLLAKEKLGISDEEILVVEDTKVGVEAAKRAGLKCVVVPNAYTKHQDFSKADYVIDSLKGVVDIVFGSIQRP